MKTRFSVYALLMATIVFAFSSCQKDTESADYSAETTAHSDDQNRFSGEVDAAANDVVLTLDATAGFAGRGQDIQSLICDATVAVDTMSNPRTITITYNGTNCIGNRTRTGVIVVSMAQGIRWKNAGAQINVSFQNLRITRVSDNKSILINGTQTYTNVSGGLLINLPVLNTITHTITSSNMSVTFDNNSQRTWQVARQRVFTYNNGVAITVTGLHTENGISGIAEWGTNRFGNSFTSAITQPLVFRQDCSFRLGSGKVEHRTAYFNATATFGLDASGNPTGCPGASSYYMKIVWTGPAGNTRSAILPY
ncbi:MAG TPA: hypothetical protein PLO99_07535 [Chitinophagaceae bacterium]|jgi:hypothetical protein|nr:hypothetical protein [Chitinophagaceae bacterium]HRG82352.1 hypothetical protein [Chitinophagaceae bacterium]